MSMPPAVVDRPNPRTTRTAPRYIVAIMVRWSTVLTPMPAAKPPWRSWRQSQRAEAGADDGEDRRGRGDHRDGAALLLGGDGGRENGQVVAGHHRGADALKRAGHEQHPKTG